MSSKEVEVGEDLRARPELSERAVLDVLPRAIAVASVDGRIVRWNRQAEALYGWTEAEVLGRPMVELLASDRASVGDIVERAYGGESWEGELSVLRRDRDTVVAYTFFAPVLGDDGAVVAVVAASEDVTARTRFEQRIAEVSAHFELALDAGELGTWRWDMSTGETRWDERLEALFGLEPGSFAGTFDAYVACLHPDDAAQVLATVEQALEQRARYTVEHRVVWPDGSVHWMQGKGQVTLDSSGEPSGTMGCVMDITEQVQAAHERQQALERAQLAAESARLSSERLSFLAQINDALSASTTQRDVMINVTHAAVPRLGDWCTIYVMSPDATTPLVEIAHTDPDRLAYVKAFQERFPYDPDSATGIAEVMRTGRSQFYPDINEDLLTRPAVSEEAREIVRALALRSAIAVPLIKRGRVIGAMQFVNAEASRKYSAEDVTLAEAVASRIASTLENRRLAEQQRSIAMTLQESLLPDTLPAIAGLDVAVRYWAAGEASTVGGDFYDGFEVDDRWVFVIGDVCGTGPRAAAITGLSRHTIRAAAWAGAEPADVLRQVNRAVLRSNQSTFVTVLYCTLARAQDGFELTVTSGGHPLPILRRADGTVETIGAPGRLLGILEESKSTTCVTRLLAGDALVLYTDGITDVRPPHALTAEDMEEIVARAASAELGAEDIADNLGRAIDREVSFAQRNDDIALLVLELRDRP